MKKTQLEVIHLNEELKALFNKHGIVDFSVTYIAGQFFVTSNGPIRDTLIKEIKPYGNER